MSKGFKVLGLIVGAGVTGVVLLYGFILIDWGGSSDALIAQARSPDGHLVAEIRRLTTAMHGGPDKLYVTVGQGEFPTGEKIYERTYECDDFSAFHLQWRSAHDLLVTYGECDAGLPRTKDRYRDFDYKQQNQVWQSDTTWQGVEITYEDSRYVATR